MNNTIRSEFEKMTALVEFKQKYEEKLKVNPLSWQMFEDVEAFHNRLNLLRIEEDKDEKVITDEKEKIFVNLENEGYSLACLLLSYGCYKDFSPFKKLEGISKTELKRARDTEVLKNLQTMNSVLHDHVDEATEAGISEERKNEFGALLLKAAEVINEPMKYRLHQTTIIDQEEQQAEAFKSLLNDALRPNMDATYAESDPELYREFLNSLHVDAIRKRRKVLTGKMRNLAGEPVKKVWISIDGQKAVKRGGVKGEFYFYNISPGKHTLEFQKASYQPIIKTIILEADRVLHLDLVFELITAEVSEDS